MRVAPGRSVLRAPFRSPRHPRRAAEVAPRPAPKRPCDVLVDAHCHLGDVAFDPDRDAVLERARQAAVGHVVVIGTTPVDSARAAALARSRPGLSATAGLHPHEASAWSADPAARLKALLGQPEVVAVGETGPDYHCAPAPRDALRWAYADQLALAGEPGQPGGAT